MKILKVFGLIVLFSALGVVAGYLISQTRHAPGLTIEYATTTYDLAKDTITPGLGHIEAVTENGSYMRANTKDGKMLLLTVATTDPPGGHLYDPDNNLVSTFLEAPPKFLGITKAKKSIDPTCKTHAPSNPDLSWTTLEESIVMGFKVVHSVQKDKEGQVIKETWDAPECGCASLVARHYFRSKNEDSMSEERAINVKVGPPDEALFTVPNDAKEVRPSVLIQTKREKAGGPAFSRPDHLAKLDALYAKGR